MISRLQALRYLRERENVQSIETSKYRTHNRWGNRVSRDQARSRLVLAIYSEDELSGARKVSELIAQEVSRPLFRLVVGQAQLTLSQFCTVRLSPNAESKG